MNISAEREKLKLRSPSVRLVTREMFPVGQPVLIEAIIDTQSGWEFDAPLHFMSPFHRYCETGSCCVEAVESRIEDLLIDLDIGKPWQPDDMAWPYTGDYLKRAFRDIRNGKRLKRWWYYQSTVIVTAWDEVQYMVTTEEQ